MHTLPKLKEGEHWVLSSRNLKNGGCNEECKSHMCIVHRLFTVNNRLYPRISISICNPNIGNEDFGIRIDCNIKEASDRWWTTCQIPIELTDEFIRMVYVARMYMFNDEFKQRKAARMSRFKI